MTLVLSDGHPLLGLQVSAHTYRVAVAMADPSRDVQPSCTSTKATPCQLNLLRIAARVKEDEDANWKMQG